MCFQDYSYRKLYYAFLLGCHCRACLVPVFSFGENDTFVPASNPPGSYLRSAQEAFKRTMGFTPPLLQTLRLLPNRRPITTVGGYSSLVQWGSFVVICSDIIMVFLSGAIVEYSVRSCISEPKYYYFFTWLWVSVG